ncbi:MAG TPA: amino acid deaminase/aldolase [Stackebrandtia sp.]|jgi:D-serine deaminase-like pyridoxal phosphate-dependent protein|uniref:amino acid deaminase/aldolase n=1 Tax=Stackebrandtia sp. TaxID=2023065 RepID=UPI002D58A9BB|nr:amino acid deaminase/aldolase [Stackebrandtia sp.]HZE40343.1 amino acid deaminase/aldolase [Stackebrandtia sp.]
MRDFHNGAEQRERYDTATAKFSPPVAIVDLDAFDANGRSMRERARSLPVRVASKSLRCRALLERALRGAGYAGILAFSLEEALWLVEQGTVDDAVIGYPTADRAALAVLAGNERAASAVTLMIDDVAQLDLVDAIAPPSTRPSIRVCIDLDASWKVLGTHLGPLRSPVHAPIDAVRLAKKVLARKGFHLVGLMSYEGQIAGLGPKGAAVPALIRLAQRRSFAELRRRRTKAVAAVRAVADLEFVNAGGTGSLELTASDPSVTELTAGSGFYAPALFDDYDNFTLQPAAAFALSVVRRAAPTTVTLHGGGWVASGAAGRSRLPRPWLPAGLKLADMEGAGEVQTPVTGEAARHLDIGDRVWFRHAKAGELCERVNHLHLIAGDSVVDTVPTYRGEGKAFL